MLSAEQRRRGRSRLLWFGVFNSLSFTLLTGNLISLYLLRLGASIGMIGVIASFSYVAFFFLIVGRPLVPRFGVIRLFAWAWLYRYIAFIPVLVAPVFLLNGSPTAVFLLVGAGVFGFHTFRGIGVVANAPLFSGFAGITDRGRFLSHFQMIASLVSIIVGVAVAYLLGTQAAIGRYVLFLGAGVGAGIIATGLLFAIPELEEERESAKRPLLPVIREMLGRPQIRIFFGMFLLIAVASGVGRSFFIVYAKQVHGFTDRLAFLMVAVGSLGNFLAGYLGSVLLDRLGARPLILFSLAAYLVSLIGAVAIPAVGGVAAIASVGTVFFLGTLGYSGNENSCQAYFFGVTQRDDRLNLGIVFYLVLGTGGMIGSFTGGFLLDALVSVTGTVWAFRIFFVVTSAIVVIAIIRAGNLASLGSETFRGTLEVIFSPRDLRTVGLLNRLDRTRGVKEEQSTLRTLAHSGSPIAVGEVIGRLESPSYAIRQEALEALATLPYSPAVQEALIHHLSAAVHTTAFMAVRILGLRGTPTAALHVRDAIRSEDRLLAERAIVAYARLAGPSALEELRRELRSAETPRLLMHVAVAIQIAGGPEELTPLLEQLQRGDLPDYVVDEILFAAARILGIQERFYPLYSAYIRDKGRADRMTLHEEMIAITENESAAARVPRVRAAVNALFREDTDDTIAKRSYAALTIITDAPSLLPASFADLASALPVRGRTVFFYICSAM